MPPRPVSRTVSRRHFLQTSAAAAGVLALPTHAFGRSGRGERLRIGVIGTQNQAGWNLAQLAGEHVAALCDVDADYLERAGAQHPHAKRFRDFRELIAAPLDLDALLVAAPDHIHAPAAALALRAGLHVYCEKPLAHTVEEARVLAQLAREHERATQMGTQIHAGSNYRRVVELVRSGAIGRVREVHVWCNKSWSNGKYGAAEPAPAQLDWNLWLGPAPLHAYSAGLHPANWRRFWAYGTGTLGDMACHYMDLVHWALELRHPTRVTSAGPPVDSIGTPAWLIVRYEHPALGERPALSVTWYDGDKRPELLQQLKNTDGSALAWGDGHLFVGDEGMVISNYDDHKLLRASKGGNLGEHRVVDHTPPERTIADSIGHHREWIEACKSGASTTCNFEYSGALSEAVLLGNVAYRIGKPLEWDAALLRAKNAPEATALIEHRYRAGWKL